MTDFDITKLPESFRKSEIKEDIVDAITYLDLSHNRRMTMTEIGVEMKLGTRQNVYNYLKRWRSNGAFQIAEEVVFLPTIVQSAVASQAVVQSWPLIVNRIIEVAVNGRSDKTAVEAAIFLQGINDKIVEGVSDAGAPEQAYAARAPDLSPDIITLPKSSVRDMVDA